MIDIHHTLQLVGTLSLAGAVLMWRIPAEKRRAQRKRELNAMGLCATCEVQPIEKGEKICGDCWADHAAAP